MKNTETKTQSQKLELTDPDQDQAKMEIEEIIIDMPEVKDIPGQEHIKVPQFKEMQDVTISSAGEEGDGLLDDLNKEDDEIMMDELSNVSETERNLLKKSAGHTPTAEDLDLKTISLNNKDDEGTALNEKSFSEERFGGDLDVPGTDLDDSDEKIGEEDEENNLYSQRD